MTQESASIETLVPQPENYTAASIKVINADDFMQDLEDPTMDWRRVEIWHQMYGKPADWIERSVRAYRNAGAPLAHFVGRYLEDRRDEFPMIKAVHNAAMAQVFSARPNGPEYEKYAGDGA